jgi:crotonobetainyl-CoA:carnitine CoA-transferase CaiB-like acyl-CoA transferase
VIKVESPDGDDTRQWGPPFIERERPDGSKERVSAYFQSTNRGKTSVICDLKNADDLERLKLLIKDADVVVENFKVGGLAKYGLDYPSLATDNPRLVYASITGFGQTGPRARQPGYDVLIQGMSGIMELTGEPEGDPQKVGVAWIDIFTGLYGVIGIQAALAEREKSGIGQHLDLSLFDTGLAVLANQAANFMIGGVEPRRLGNAHPNIAPYQVFPASDGHLIVTCGNDRQFASFCEVLGINELARKPEFATNAARIANREAMTEALCRHTSIRTRHDLISSLEDANVPAGPINRVSEALADPQTEARGLKINPDGIAALAIPIKFSRSRKIENRASPMLGDN